MFKSCACFGQNEIKNKNALESSLKVMFEYLIIEQKTEVFYFVGVGVFDEIAREVLKTLKAKFSHIKLVLACPKIEGFETQVNFEFDEVIKFSEKNEFSKMPLFSRDYILAKKADFLVFYVAENSKNKALKLLEFAKAWDKKFVNLI